jgi:nucleoside-diphosphate-sugar epimerase
MKLFVLGAGYVGKAVLSRFKDDGHLLYASTTHQENVDTLKFYTQHVFVVRGFEKEKLQEVIDRCDGLIILVAPKHHEKYEETYLSTAKTISAALAGRQKPFYLLYTSSISVYEGVANEWATEELIGRPQSKNGQILIEAEKIYFNCSNEKVKTCILRLGGIYGPNRELVQRARDLSGKEMSGTGDEPTNHIHLEDIVSAIEFCLNHHLSGIYNLVNDDHPSRKRFYSSLCHSLGIPPPTWNSSLSGGRGRGYKVSNEKISNKGFTFKRPSIDS